MTTPDRTLVIAGAGIGGLALAAGLRKQGLPVTVFERRNSLAEVGAGISLWPNALAALDQLGLGAEVRSLGGQVASGGVRRPNGTWIQRVDRDAYETALGEPLVVIHRADLLDVLRAAVEPSSLRLGIGVEGFEVGANGIEVRLSDGSTEIAQGLIGADGVHSGVARQLWPQVHLRFAGYTAWRGIAQFGLGIDHVPGETWGVGGEFGFLPLGADRTYWFATENTAEGGRASEGELTYLRDRFGEWHAPIPAILAATDTTGPGHVLRNDIYDRALTGKWTHGPVAVIGDAAHPMRPHLGQGGCQALEDSVVLSRQLSSGDPPAQAFQRYESARRRRVRRIVRESANLGRFIQAPRPFAPHIHRLASMMPEGLLIRHLAGVAGRDALD